MANDLKNKIVKQLEYYFGDYNLQRDTFLKQEIGADDGWVELKTLLTFPRLSNLTTDPQVIIEALKNVENPMVLVSEDDKKVRRDPKNPVPDLTDEGKKEMLNRSAYAKGFPLDEALDNIMSFLEEYGPIVSCYKRTYLDKATKEHKFKGSCFIVFKELEKCKKFVEAESIKYKDTELLRKFQHVYIEEKKQENHKRRNEKKNKKEEKNKVEESKITLPKQAILHFSGITDEQVLTREEIKEKFTEINGAEPAYIDFSKGDKKGHIRLTNENGAPEFFKKLTDGIMEVGEVKLQFKVLEGEEEEQFLEKTIEAVSQRRQSQKKGKKNNKRQGFHNRDGHKAKKAKN